jgi:D-alanine transfer protein
MTKKAVFSPIICAFLAFLFIMAIPNSWIEGLIPKSRVSQAATQLNPFMFQGTYIQSKMLEDNRYLPIYGSSELARLDAFHPSNYFQVNDDGFVPFLIGRGGSISIIHFLNFAEHTDQLKGKKLVFVLSPQWFQPKGADENHFVPNYSSLQGYDLALNNNIDPALKQEVIKRLLHFIPIKDDKILSILYRGEISNDPWAQAKAYLVRPLAYINRAMLQKKDLYYSFVGGTNKSREINPAVKNKSWSQLKQMATAEGARQATNNRFGVINSQYNKMKKSVPHLKGYKKGASYGRSLEYYDFQLVLDLLKQSGAKPLFISVPVNGPWYDYTGFPKQGLTSYYKRIKHQVQAEGFPIADFSGHDYDPYFMKDTIHIGWKGWVYVDKAIKDFYNNNENQKKSIQM